MYFFGHIWEQALVLLDRGGWVLVAILLLSTLMWILIIERYWYFHKRHDRQVKRAVTEWETRKDHTSWCARRIREGLIAQISAQSRRFLIPIQSITNILPLLGLLGTVLGMISTFDVLVVFGTGNGRGFAEGISQALINSTAGLVTAIAGLYFASRIQRRHEKEQQLISDRMV